MEAKRSTRVPRKLWLAIALVVVVGALLLAQNSTVVVPEMTSYAVVDQRTHRGAGRRRPVQLDASHRCRGDVDRGPGQGRDAALPDPGAEHRRACRS